MPVVAYPLDAVNGEPVYASRDLRQGWSTLVAGATTERPFGARAGVRPGTSASTVTVSGSSVTIKPHAGVLDPVASALAGPYFYAVDTATTLQTDAPHATYARIDAVWVELLDPSEDMGAEPGIRLRIAAGAPAPINPAPPDVPDRALVLARIHVPPVGQEPTAEWVAPPCGAADGVPTFRDEARRDLALREPPVGQLCVIGSELDLRVQVWDGLRWRRIDALQNDSGWLPLNIAWTMASKYIPKNARYRIIGAEGLIEWFNSDPAYTVGNVMATGMPMELRPREGTTACGVYDHTHENASGWRSGLVHRVTSRIMITADGELRHDCTQCGNSSATTIFERQFSMAFPV